MYEVTIVGVLLYTVIDQLWKGANPIFHNKPKTINKNPKYKESK